MRTLSRAFAPMSAAVLIVSLGACGSAAEQATTEGAATSSVVAGEDSAEASATPSPDSAAGVVLKVDEYGFTQFPKTDFSGPSVSYGAVISNSGTQIATNVRVQIGLEDAAGAVVDSAEKYLTAILPGTSLGVADTAFDAAGVTKLSVQVLPGESEAVEGEAGNFTVSKVATKAVEYGGIKTTAVVGSPFTKDLKDLEAVAIYRDAKGKIIGGDFTFLGFVPAKGTAALSIDSISFQKKPAKTDVYVGLSSLSLLE